jgi:hypothetical protein
VPPPPMFVPGQIKVKGTQAPAAGWGFSSASVYFLNNAGGTIVPPAALQEKNGDLGKLDPATNTIVEFVAGGAAKGTTYTVWIMGFYMRPKPGEPGTIEVVPISSPVSQVTIN